MSPLLAYLSLLAPLGLGFVALLSLRQPGRDPHLVLAASKVANVVALIVAGAMCFIISDAILAAERFLLKNGVAKQFAGPAVWITYYAAQVLILLGVLSVN